MAPFIPEGIVNPELNFFFALVLGIAFGYVLEQAGFSSSRKLAGVFYGYDFVVLKVFFTAGITAMTGILLLDYLGWIDMDLVYINPTFLWSALVGGVIMGFGFILGGFCPGTSIVGAVIGKIDAMVFILGLIIGVFLFGHFYQAFEPIYTGSFYGHLFVHDVLGLPKHTFAIILAAVALLAFTFTQMIEDRVNKVEAAAISARPSYRLPSFLLLIVLFVLWVLPDQRISHMGERGPEEVMARMTGGSAFTSRQKAIFHLVQEHTDVIFIDVRDSRAYAHFSLPGAVHIPPDELLDRRWRRFFRKDPRQKIFFSDASSAAVQAYFIATRAGFNRISVMEGGLNGMFSLLFEEDPLPAPGNRKMEAHFSARFIEQARRFFMEGKAAPSDAQQNRAVIQTYDPPPTPVAGGC